MATINGTALANLLNGTAAADTINGLAGNDTLNGGAGNDRMDGGAGNDLYIVNSALDLVIEAAGTGSGTDTVQASVSFTLPVNVENLTLTGAGNISGTGNAAANSLTGNAGNNSLSALGGNDTLSGLGGNDTLNGGTGDDAMSGGAGNDLYIVDSELDRVIETVAAGTDTVRAAVSYLLSANVENLVLTGTDDADGDGNSLANAVTGNSGDNTLVGKGGNDTLTGGAGDDDLSGNSGADLLRGDAGDDELSGGAGNDTLEGGAGDDNLTGGAGNDVLNGGAGADFLSGGSGFDTVTYAGAAAGVIANLGGFGSGGDALGDSYSGTEKLVGSAHADSLTGDALANVIDGGAGADEIHAGGGNDTIFGDAADTVFDGGAGDDRVLLAGGGQVYDYASGDSPLIDVAYVDLSAAGADTLILDGDAVSQAGPLLFVEGTAEDTLAATDLWILGGDIDETLTSYRSVSDGSFLFVDRVIDRSDIQVALSLGSLDAAFGGVRINGAEPGLRSGWDVSSAGDVNGDGYDDVIVSSYRANTYAGAAYVVFGGSALSSGFELASLDGGNGFRLVGAASYDRAGMAVSAAGDVNGDGLGDLIVAAPLADPGANTLAGSTYVVFGRESGFGSSVELSSLDGTTGYRIDGASEFDYSGGSVSAAGDVNGDGLADVLIGTSGGDVGAVYVVFGSQAAPASVMSVTALGGGNGFRIDGVVGTGFSDAVAGGGDINGDGYADLVIGAPGVDTGGTNAGESYVVFGASSFGSVLAVSSLDGSGGFVLRGGAAFDVSGAALSLSGDFNGDGWADVVVSSPWAEVGDRNDAGATYVVFGHDAPFSHLDLTALDGSDGFRLVGIDESDASGLSLASAGDVNGDGFDDLLINHTRFLDYSGETYLVFGRASGFGSSFELSSLGGDDGYRILGASSYTFSGGSISAAGDVNGDGFADIIVGARGTDTQYDLNEGASYVVYGGDFSGAVTHAGTTANDAINGTAGADVIIGGEGDDVLSGGGGADVLRGGQGDDLMVIAGGGFLDIDGGRGNDILGLDGNLDLDLTTIGDSLITGIETIDLVAGSGSNSLKLDLSDLLNLSDTSNTLTIEGDSNDSVEVGGGGWSGIAGPLGYNAWTNGAATLLVVDVVQINLPI